MRAVEKRAVFNERQRDRQVNSAQRLAACKRLLLERFHALRNQRLLQGGAVGETTTPQPADLLGNVRHTQRGTALERFVFYRLEPSRERQGRQAFAFVKRALAERAHAWRQGEVRKRTAPHERGLAYLLHSVRQLDFTQGFAPEKRLGGNGLDRTADAHALKAQAPTEGALPQLLDAFRQLDFAQVRAAHERLRAHALDAFGDADRLQYAVERERALPDSIRRLRHLYVRLPAGKARQRQLELFAHFAHGASSFRNGRPTTGAAQNGRLRVAAFFFELQQHMAAYGDHPCTNPHIFPAFRSQNEGNVRVCLPFLPALRTPAAPGARTPRPCA